MRLTAEERSVTRRERLRRLIRDRSFKEGEFTLASGKKSNVFFDLKQIMLNHEGLNLLADEALDNIKSVDARYIGGLAMGAVPILISVVLKSDELSNTLDGFWVRKQEKDHGMKGRIDGPVEPESDVIIIDDVTTTGESVLQAVDAVEDIGCRIRHVLTMVDRCEGAEERIRQRGYTLHYLFNRYDFTDKRPGDIGE